MSKYQLTAIIELLNPDNTISAHRMLAHSIGMTETIIYSALISKQTYYSQNGMLLEGGWFYSTVYDLQESTTFGVKAQKTAIKHLMEHGLIECEFKGMPAKRYFRIIDSTDKLIDFIKEGTEISRKIVSAAKEHNAEKRGTRNEDISENQAEANIDENTENPCSYPSAGTCPRPAAGTCSDLPHGKTKDNIKPNVDNLNINQSINQTDERPMERYKPLKFSEILYELGVEWITMTAIEPKNEKHFSEWDEGDRKTQKCKIPYSFKDDKQAMTAALRYLTAFSYYFTDSSNTKQRDVVLTVISALSEMVHTDTVTLSGERVKYCDIIDKLNEIIEKSYLSDWIFAFEEKWKLIIAEKDLRHPRAYMKSCLWNSLKDDDLESYNEEEKLRAEFGGR